MKKIKKIGSKRIKEYVKEQISDDNFLLPEHKIDKIINEYLFERSDSLDNYEPLNDKYEFSPKVKESLLDMVDVLTEISEDLDIIKEKEGDVLLFSDVYADEYLIGLVKIVIDLVDDLKYLSELKDNNKIEE